MYLGLLLLLLFFSPIRGEQKNQLNKKNKKNNRKNQTVKKKLIKILKKSTS
jgi:hypothetical protein